jgi:hypothetical protein
MARTEHDIRAALLTLVPDPTTDAGAIEAVHRKIARRGGLARTTVIAASVASVGVAASLALAIAPSARHLPHPRQTQIQPQISAPLELRTLAKVAAVQPTFRMPGPGQFWYTETKGFGGLCLKAINPHEARSYYQNCYIHVLEVVRTQMWIAADGSGHGRNTVIYSHFPSARDRAHWIAAGRPNLNVSPANLRFPKHELSIGLPGLGKLPTKEAKLAKLIRSRNWEGGPPGPAEDLTQITDLLRSANASPKLRAAAFEVGARIPGVKSLGVVTFHGVTGAAIALTIRDTSTLPVYKGSYVREERIFDRTTSTLKAEVNTIVRAGKILEVDWVTYPAARLVNSTDSTPGL